MCYWKHPKRSWLCILAAIIGILLVCGGLSSAAYLVGPSAHWKLDEDKNASGFSGYLDEVTGLYSNCSGGISCPVINAGILVDNSQVFNGSNTGINVAWNESIQFAPNTSFSIELWMRKSISNGAPEVIVGRDATDQQLQWWVGVSNDDKARFVLVSSADNSDPTEYVGLKGTSVVTDGEWHYITAVKQDLGLGDGSTDVKLYVDGVLEASEAAVFLKGFQDPTVGMGIGYYASNGTPSNHFQGSVDEVAIYKAYLDEDTIRQHYINGLQGFSYDEDAAPSIVTPGTVEIMIGHEFTFDVDAVGNPIPTYELINPPTDMTIGAQTGEIQWAATTLADTDVTVRTSSAAGQDEQVITFSVVEPCATDLMAHWMLEEDSSDADFAGYVDAIGTSSNGTCVGGCPTRVDGQVSGIAGQTNYAQAFSGGQGIDVEPNAAFDWELGDSLTIALWVQRNGNPSAAEVIIGRDGLGSNLMHWWLGVSPQGLASFWLLDSDGEGGNVKSNVVVTDNLWHHVMVVLSDNGLGDGSGELRIYVDGDLQSSLEVTYTGSFQSATRPMNIGYLDLNGSPGNQFNGQVDEIAIYHRAFSDAMAWQHAGVFPDRNYCNDAPSITSTAPTTATESEPYSYSATAVDLEDDTLTWTLSDEPSGMTVDTASGEVSWIPAEGVTSSGQVTLTVDDGFGGAASQQFTISVTSVNNAPQITSTAPTAATVGALYTYQPVADDPEGDTLTWYLTNEPSGMTIDSATGEITWTPGEGVTTSGEITVTVSDGSQSDSETFTLTVTDSNSAPTITTTAGTTVEVGQVYLYDADATDSDVPADTLIWALSNEPNGMVVDSSTGVVTWTPADGVTTSGTVTLTVSDGTASATETFEVTVTSGGDGDGDGGGGGGGGCFIAATDSRTVSMGQMIAGMVAILALCIKNGIVHRN